MNRTVNIAGKKNYWLSLVSIGNRMLCIFMMAQSRIFPLPD